MCFYCCLYDVVLGTGALVSPVAGMWKGKDNLVELALPVPPWLGSACQTQAIRLPQQTPFFVCWWSEKIDTWWCTWKTDTNDLTSSKNASTRSRQVSGLLLHREEMWVAPFPASLQTYSEWETYIVHSTNHIFLGLERLLWDGNKLHHQTLEPVIYIS